MNNRYNILPSYKYIDCQEQIFDKSAGKPLRNYQFVMPDGSENCFGKIYGKNLFSTSELNFSGANAVIMEPTSENSFTLTSTAKGKYQYKSFFIGFDQLIDDTFHFSFNVEASDLEKLNPAIIIRLAHSSDVSNIVTNKKTIRTMGYSEFSYTLTQTDKEKYDIVRIIIYTNSSNDSELDIVGQSLTFTDVMFSCIDTNYEPYQKPIEFHGEELLNPYAWYSSKGYEKYTLISVNDNKDITITKGNDTASNNLYLNLGDYQKYAGKTFNLTGYISDTDVEIGTSYCVAYFQKYLTEDKSDTPISIKTARIDLTERTTLIEIPEDPEAKILTMRIYCQSLSNGTTGAVTGNYLTISDLSLKDNNYEKMIIPTHKGYNTIIFDGEQPSEFNIQYYKKG